MAAIDVVDLPEDSPFKCADRVLLLEDPEVETQGEE